MPTKTLHAKATADLPAWQQAITSLIDEIASWARAEDWSVHRGHAELTEERIGSYSVPTLRLRSSNSRNELFVTPVALQIVGAAGRVDVEAWPSLDRVMLVRVGNAWRIVADDNVELNSPWGRETFLGLARGLFAFAP